MKLNYLNTQYSIPNTVVSYPLSVIWLDATLIALIMMSIMVEIVENDG